MDKKKNICKDSVTRRINELYNKLKKLVGWQKICDYFCHAKKVFI